MGRTLIDWHRLFGVALADFFAGSPFEVELEKELSARKQYLDVVILRRRPGEFAGPLPDGLEDLAEHNLLSYKSLREPLDDWAIDELVGHYVNYRKQVSPSRSRLLPASAFRLYGVSTRFPEKLAGQVTLVRREEGVYEAVWGTHRVTVLALSEIPEGEPNAVWNLFSSVPAKVAVGRAYFRGHTADAPAIMDRLYEHYQLEGLAMPYTMEDFRRDAAREILSELPPEERLRGLTPEERLRGLPAEERLRGLPLRERLREFSPEEIRAYLESLDQQEKDEPRH